MRVGNLVASVSRRAGGVFHAVRHLAIHTQSLGCDVTVFGMRDEFTDPDRAAWGAVSPTVLRVVGPRSFGFAPHLVDIIRESGIDVLHVHGLWMYCSLASLIVCREGKVPCVISPHGHLNHWALRNSAWKKRAATWMYEGAHLRAAACLHALCESDVAGLRALGFRNPICLIPNGQDLPELARAHKPESGIAPGRNVLLFLGRLHPQKGVANLLHAWAACQKTERRARDWALVVAGWNQKGHEQLLKDMARDLGIKDSVLFPGPLFEEAKDNALRSAQAFVLPSYSEGLPLAVLEAWAYGLPAIISGACNLPEGFSHGAAIKADPELSSLAQVLRTLFSMSESDLEQMGLRGRFLVQQRFSWPKIVKQWISVYTWVLGDGPKPDCILEATHSSSIVMRQQAC